MAAGRGERLGADLPKAFTTVAGRPMLEWSVEALRASPSVTSITVALPPGEPLPDAPAGTQAVTGGECRSLSVRLALEASLADDCVVVHDAARPLVTADIVEEALRSLLADETLDGVIVAARVTDTVKRSDQQGLVTETLDRAGLWAVQTPQVFRREALERALSQPDEVLALATDDAWLVERAGGRVAILESDAPNLKVTTPADLAEAKRLLLARC